MKQLQNFASKFQRCFILCTNHINCTCRMVPFWLLYVILSQALRAVWRQVAGRIGQRYLLLGVQVISLRLSTPCP